jgi:multidrug efflux pump subunit AcrB
VFALAGRANQRFHQIRGAFVVAFAPPAALELGNATGFDFELEDRGNIGHKALMQARLQLLGLASKDPTIGSIRPNGLDDEPQYKLDIDWEKASALGIPIGNINDALGAGWGSAFVNQFVDRNRVKRVFLQGDADSRMLPQDLGLWYVRNGAGQMVSFSTLAEVGALQRHTGARIPRRAGAR